MPDAQPIYYPGKDLFISLNGINIGCDTTCDIEIMGKAFDNSNKCTVDGSGNLFGSSIVTMVTAKITGSGFTVADAATSGGTSQEYSTAKLMQLCINRTKCYASWFRGGLTYGMDVYISSIKETAKYDEISSYSYTLDSAGPLFQFPVS